MTISIKEDFSLVLSALGNEPRSSDGYAWIDGKRLQEITKLPPPRINDAVALLRQSRLVEVTTAMGTAPFDFRSVQITPRGRYELERSKTAKGTGQIVGETAPIEIQESLRILKKDHPDPTKVGFIMMKFKDTPAHKKISEAIKSTLREYGLEGIRSDDREYHKTLLYNVETYLHGCGFGIAVFDRIEEEEFSPNVSLEVGYMMALRKHVCLLKDKTLQTLHADLLGELYKPFDPQDPEKTIPEQLSKWLSDKQIGSRVSRGITIPSITINPVISGTVSLPIRKLRPKEILAFALYQRHPNPVSPEELRSVISSEWNAVDSDFVEAKASELRREARLTVDNGKYVLSDAGLEWAKKVYDKLIDSALR